MFSWIHRRDMTSAVTMRSTLQSFICGGDVHRARCRTNPVEFRDGVRPSPASPATSPPNISIILMRFLRAKTESSTTR